MTTKVFDVNRANLNSPDMFERFRVPEMGQPLKEAGLSPATELLVFERGNERRALIAREMAYHHLAQGTLAGQPYLISF